ncbi:hypothetical protein ACWDA7_30365 [Streptomyces sp. NPDC001156]
MSVTYQGTRDIPIDEITPYPGNAKRGNVEQILNSLRRNGQYRGLVIREIPDGPLIALAGNHTMQALALHGAGDCGETVKVGGKERPCGVCHNGPWEPVARCEVYQCDDATARRINLADNRTAELGTYDNEALAELLRELDGDFDGTGYTPQALDDLTSLLELPPEDADELTRSHGEPNDEVFRPQIQLTVTADTFDRWRAALDAHKGDDDEAKLRGLLTEVEQAREDSA